MNTSAIHQAILLSKYPDEMERLTSTSADFPGGITDLLRLCASNQKMDAFSERYDIDTETLHKILLGFIDQVILNQENRGKRVLGIDSWDCNDNLKLHYQLLIKIYHPDINTSSYATEQTTRITKAYKLLRSPQDGFSSDYKNITLSHVPPKSFHHASQNIANQNSGFKTAFMTLSGLVIISLGIAVTYLYDPTKTVIVSNSESLPSTQDVTLSDSKNLFSKASLGDDTTSTKAELQAMLKNLESYYEAGNVKQIRPILANSPETENQTDEQIQAKLETLFKITNERKMLLFDFEWINTSDSIHGTGKFLSRYHMKGDTSWVTRKGTAEVTLKEHQNKKLSITSFMLENNDID